MNKAIKYKAKYITLVKAGTDKSEGKRPLVRWFLHLLYELRVRYWLWRVNRMSEGQIIATYHAMTTRR